MERLLQEAFEKGKDLYSKEALRFPMIAGVLEGNQPGAVWGTPSNDPEIFFVSNFFGFSHLFPKQKLTNEELLLSFFQEERSSLSEYLLCYGPPEELRHRVMQFQGKTIQDRERVQFTIEEGEVRRVVELTKAPEGFALEAVSKENIDRVGDMGVGFPDRFWGDRATFLKNGLGAIAQDADGEVAAICYSSGVGDGRAEIDVLTKETYRGKGLGTAVTGKFFELCFERGVKPNWDCFRKNEASVKLAEKMGFKENYKYFFLTFNRNDLIT